MSSQSRGFKAIFKKHLERCKIENYVNELKEPKEFLEWLARGRKAKCYLCQDDLSSLYIAGPGSKMMDRRNSSADTGNHKKDYTRDNIAYICDQCQIAKRSLPEAVCVAPCAVRWLMHTKTRRCSLVAMHRFGVEMLCGRKQLIDCQELRAW
jgi:hypothetical protein